MVSCGGDTVCNLQGHRNSNKIYLVREFYQIFGKSGNKFPTKKFLHQYVC